MTIMVEPSLSRKTLTIRKHKQTLIIRQLTKLVILYRLIIAFKVEELKEGDEFKASWKDVEKTVREKLPKLKIVYSRGDDKSGHLAISNLRLKDEMVDSLVADGVVISEKKFTFEKISGETLKEFWSEQGGHYNFCIQNKLRAAKKAAKKSNMEKREGVKRAKKAYKVAGQFYLDINKVRSKSRAIMNLKQDGERLEGNDEQFVKEIIDFHHSSETKMKDFEAFEVNVHPQFEKTRCFFVVRKDGTKEDFSITKCIQALENSME